MKTKNYLTRKLLMALVVITAICINSALSISVAEAKSKNIDVTVISGKLTIKNNKAYLTGKKLGSSSSKKITMCFDRKTKLKNTKSLDAWKKGDTAVKWLKRLKKQSTIQGVYHVKMTGKHVDVVKGLTWWD